MESMFQPYLNKYIKKKTHKETVMEHVLILPVADGKGQVINTI